MNPDIDYRVPEDVAAMQRPALLVGIVALIACGAGFVIDPEQFYRSWLVGFMFWLGIALGSLALLMVQHLSGGGWGVFRRVWEASSRTLPFLLLCFLPLAFGVRDLYEWARPEVVANDAVLQHKAAYLNVPFFLLRAAFYFASWILVAFLMTRWSREQDATGSFAPTRRMHILSGGGLVLYGLTITYASIDWVMSLSPHWYSTIFGFLFIAGQGLSSIAFTITIGLALARRRPMDTVLLPGHFHDLGKLLLAFVMLWAYFSFSQFLIIWSGNLIEEIPYYTVRMNGGWGWIGLGLIFVHFGLPFLLLLSRDLKRAAPRLAKVAILLMVMRVIDLLYLVVPEFHEHLRLHWLDVAAPVAIGGLWLAVFFANLRSRSLLPTRDPYLVEALAQPSGH